MPGDHEQFMRMALEDAARGKAEGYVAVGSLIVQDGTVVARGRNLVTTTFDPTAHAETVALREAGRILQRVDFSGCVLDTTSDTRRRSFDGYESIIAPIDHVLMHL
jgi:tRNA(adenine34) deaminase